MTLLLDASLPVGGDRTAHRPSHLALQAIGGAAKKGAFGSNRPRHTLRGKQDAQAVTRSGLRVRWLKQQAPGGDRLAFCRRVRGPHPPLSRPRLGQVRSRSDG